MRSHGEVTWHDRKLIAPEEIDIVVRSGSMCIGIEYDGLFWHSIDNPRSNHNNASYHVSKTSRRADAGC